MNKYLVARCVGGFNEFPVYSFENFQVIEAYNPDEAEQTYNKVNGYSGEYCYFYGHTLCEYDSSLEWLITHRPIDADVVKKLLGQKLIEDEDE